MTKVLTEDVVQKYVIALVGCSLILFQNCGHFKMTDPQVEELQSITCLDEACTSVDIDTSKLQGLCQFNGQPVPNGGQVTASLESVGKPCQSETRTCQDGWLSGSYLYAYCAESSMIGVKKACLFNGETISHGAKVTSYLSSVPTSDNVCQTESRFCTDGVLSGSYMYADCQSNKKKSCLYNGITVPDMGLVWAAQASSVLSPASCDIKPRVCLDGALTGDYAFPTCVVNQPASCLFNGQSVASSSKTVAFEKSSVPYLSTCKQETRTCFNGELSGSYAAASCVVEAAKACPFDGANVNHGVRVTAYQTASVPFAQTCVSENRTCTNGNLSGAYAFSKCSVDAAKSCSFNGQTIASGASTDAFEKSSVPFGSVCQKQKRDCTNGSLSGTYASASCVVEAAKACSFNGQAIAHGAMVNAYSQATVAYGQTCAAETRSCNDGNLLGSFTSPTCSVDLSCAFEGQTTPTIPNGSTVTAYDSASVSYYEKCIPKTVQCVDRILRSSAKFASCTVAPFRTCNWKGQTLGLGDEVFYYASPTVASTSLCDSVKVKVYCRDGQIQWSDPLQLLKSKNDADLYTSCTQRPRQLYCTFPGGTYQMPDNSKLTYNEGGSCYRYSCFDGTVNRYYFSKAHSDGYCPQQ